MEENGLGPIAANPLGVTLYWVRYCTASLHGMWWFMSPVVIISVRCSGRAVGRGGSWKLSL